MFRSASVLVAAALFTPASAAAWSSQGLQWPDADLGPVTYMVDPEGSDDAGSAPVIAAARAAFASWEAVACSYLDFEEQTWTPAADPSRPIGNDGIHRVFFAETEGTWPGNAGTLALTFVFHTLDASKAILDADIVINGVDWGWTTDEGAAGTGTPARVDVETVLFHEVGHFFGLDHSQDPDAAMFASNNKVVQRAPARDDVEGICALYSNGEALPHDPGAGEGAPVGAPCLDNMDCASSICLEDRDRDNETYCSRRCDPTTVQTCPAGFECAGATDIKYCLKPEPVDELCDQCNLHEHCVTGLCAKVPNVNGFQPFCTQTCDPAPGQPAQCPEGYQCRLTQQQTTQVAVCVPVNGVCEPRGKGGHLEACFGNGTCKPGHGCFDYAPGLPFCYALCDARAAGQSCGTPRSVCTALEAVPNTAVCFEIARPGEPCIPEQCDASSLCAYDEASGVDSATCYQVCPGGRDEECPANYDCLDAGLGAPVCVPLDGFRQLGESCRSDAECESRACRVYDDNQLCTQTCATTDPEACDPGLVCVPTVGDTQGLCFPRSLVEGAEEPEPVDPPGFCSCDFTSGCDAECECDPDCGGCRHVQMNGEPASGLGGLLLAGMGIALVRRRRSGAARR